MTQQREAALIGGIAALVVVLGGVGITAIIQNRPAVAAPVVPTVNPEVIVEATSTPATSTTSTVQAPKPINARNFIAGDMTTGEILASHKSDDVWPLASITKLMTATIAIREIAPDEPITIVAVPGGNPSSLGIPIGQVFTMKDVLEVMLVSSSNEAAESLAAHVGREKFIRDMNAQARDWGLPNTVYNDASGLSAANRSTAREVFQIAKNVWEANPQIFQITRKSSVTIHAQGTGVAYTGVATHALIHDSGFLGGKTGYTDEARGNLLSIFQVGPRVEALVVLGSDDRFGDTRRLLTTLKTK